MTSRKAWTAGLVALALWPTALRAQIPGVPPLPAAGGAGAATSALGAGGGLGGLGGATTAAQPTTLWSFLGLSGSNLQACKAKLCASPLGQMANSMVTGPLGAVTGGFLPPLCPPPTAAQAAALGNQPGAGAQAAAAKIQADEAGAKARVAAVEYLGTVDCSRWPEATSALVKALLEDHNECVRFAAAKALNSGCCCNKDTIEALRICVSGETKKGNAPETSPRVKAAAFAALQNCLMRVPEDLPEDIKPPDIKSPDIKSPDVKSPDVKSPDLKPLDLKPVDPVKSQTPVVPPPPTPNQLNMNAADGTHIATAYTEAEYARVSPAERKPQKSFSQTVDEARRTLFQVSRNPRQPAFLPTGKRSVLDVLAKSRQDARAATLQHARDQGQVPPLPRTVDPGFAPAAYTPAPAPLQVNPLPAATNTEPVPLSALGIPDQQTGNDPATTATGNNARRGLIGMLFQGRNRQADQ
jgi:hypothetical protein